MNDLHIATGRMPVYFLSHGGGPWPYMEGGFREHMRWLEAALKDIPRQLPVRPTAIVVVSSHWECNAFSVTSSSAPGMVYDFYGFPPEMYTIQYPAPGSPPLAARMVELIEAAGCRALEHGSQGFDHSTYSLLKPIYPEANIPVVQLSLHRNFDPANHLRVGQALAPLRDEGVLIVGSGMSCHEHGPRVLDPSAQFDTWLRHALMELDPNQREQALVHWQQAPHARTVHPREDHLMPLMVAAGAADGDRAVCVYGERLMESLYVSSFCFGGKEASSVFDRNALPSTPTI
jgi:aromatic ring-opening dioxygenase catalytic subunit (LigB family)